MAAIRPALESVQYDGTNGTYIGETFLSNTTVGSDDGQTLQLVDNANDPIVTLNDWVVRSAQSATLFRFEGVFSPADYEARYVEIV